MTRAPRTGGGLVAKAQAARAEGMWGSEAPTRALG